VVGSRRPVVLLVAAVAFFAMACPVACESALGQTAGPRPKETLGDAKLPASVKHRIYRAFRAEFDGEGLERSAMDGFEVKVIQLSPDGRKGLRVWGTSQDAIFVCGATGNCPIWVFDSGTGDLLLSANGWELRAETTVHNGCYDFVTRHNMSAASGIRDWYRFDGHTYKQVRETAY